MLNLDEMEAKKKKIHKIRHLAESHILAHEVSTLIYIYIYIFIFISIDYNDHEDDGNTLLQPRIRKISSSPTH